MDTFNKDQYRVIELGPEVMETIDLFMKETIDCAPDFNIGMDTYNTAKKKAAAKLETQNPAPGIIQFNIDQTFRNNLPLREISPKLAYKILDVPTTTSLFRVTTTAIKKLASKSVKDSVHADSMSAQINQAYNAIFQYPYENNHTHKFVLESLNGANWEDMYERYHICYSYLITLFNQTKANLNIVFGFFALRGASNAYRVANTSDPLYFLLVLLDLGIMALCIHGKNRNNKKYDEVRQIHQIMKQKKREIKSRERE